MPPNTFRELYCQRRHCPSKDFERKLFWRALHPHARLLAPFFFTGNRDHFLAEWGLIASAANATSMDAIRSQLRDFYWQSNGSGWWHRVARIRISVQRFERIASLYLPEKAEPPSTLPETPEPAAVSEPGIATVPADGTIASPDQRDAAAAWAEINARQQDLEAWEADLRRQEMEIKSRSARLRGRETLLQERQAQLELAEADLNRGRHELEARRRALQSQANRFAEA